MGLLAPLYALAALAIAGPIIFHLIRRQPQGQLPFSSLMFLTPSPPRLTRKSRLDNLLLLLLRALAILLIAIAFARPYLRQESLINSSLSGRQIVAIVDTSASMRRADVWDAGQRELTQLLDSLSPSDHISLYTLDSSLQAVVGLGDDGVRDAAASQQAVRAAQKQLQPSWETTQLADGIRSAADLVNAASISGKIDPGANHEIVLISDLHAESQLEALQGYPWPDSIRLDVRRILPALPGNARVSLMMPSEDDQAEETSLDSGYRVRVENNPTSQQQTFGLTWASADGALQNAGTTLQVPPGQVRVVPMPARPANADRIRLTNDSWDADNDAFVVQPIVSVERILYLGKAAAEPQDDLSYFLEKAPLDSDVVKREIQRVDSSGLSASLATPESKSIVIDFQDGLAADTEVLRNFARQGGTIIVCLSRANAVPGAGPFLDRLLDVSGCEVSEAESQDFALISNIDFRNSVFAPFSDPRFNDFGKIRIWSHRRVSLPDNPTLQTLASFDDESPMLVGQEVDGGQIWLLTCGWQPSASSLALSSKFVPIVLGLLDPGGRLSKSQMTYEVGEEIDVSAFDSLVVSDNSGAEVTDPTLDRQNDVLRIREPGLYRLRGDNLERQIAIQIPASESRLQPLDVDVFEQYGVTIGKIATDEQRRESMRQLQIEELEKKQRLWQWLLTAGIVVLAVETFLAGWFARKLV